MTSPTSRPRRSPRAACWTRSPSRRRPDFTDGAIEVRGGAWLGGAATAAEAVNALLGELGPDSYLSVQAYFDRLAYADLEGVRDELAAVSRRPVTFGWGPRFLHSTGQFHKGGPAIGVFLQVTAASAHGPRHPGPPVHVRRADLGAGRG